MDVAGTVKTLKARQFRADPCLWAACDSQGELVGMLAAQVDDFLITGDPSSPRWLRSVEGLKGAYALAPWETESFDHWGGRFIPHGHYGF